MYWTGASSRMSIELPADLKQINLLSYFIVDNYSSLLV